MGFLLVLPLVALSGCLQESEPDSDDLFLSHFSSCHRRLGHLTEIACDATEPASAVPSVPSDAACRRSLYAGASESDPEWWLGVWMTEGRIVHLEFAASPRRPGFLLGEATLEMGGVTHRLHGHLEQGSGSRLILTTSFNGTPATLHGKMNFYSMQIESNHSALQPKDWIPRYLDTEIDGRVQAYYIWEFSYGPYWFDSMINVTIPGEHHIRPSSMTWTGEDFMLALDVRAPFPAAITVDPPEDSLLPPLGRQLGDCVFPSWY